MSRPPTAHGGAGAAPEYSRRDLQGHKHNVCAVAWASSGKRLASASEDGVVKLWTIEHSSTVRKEERWEQELVHGTKDHVVCLAFHPKKDELLAVVGANVTKVYDLRSKSASVVCQAPTPDAIAAAWDGRDSLLVAQLHNTFTHIEVRRKRAHRPAIMREGDEVTGLAFIEGGHKLLVATRFGAEVWSWPAWEKLAVLSGHSLHHGRDGGVTAMAVGRGDRLLVTGGMDAQVVLWDLPSATPVKAVYLPDQAVRALSVSADLAMVAYCQDATPGQACSLDVVSTTTGSYLYRVLLSKPTESLAFNPRYPNMAAFAAETAVSTSGSVRDSYSRDAKPKEVLAGKVGILFFGK